MLRASGSLFGDKSSKWSLIILYSSPMCVNHLGSGRTSGQNFRQISVSGKIYFVMFRVARNLHSCHTRINVSTKGNFPAPAKSISRYIKNLVHDRGTTRCGFHFCWPFFAFNMHVG